jgi:hypothetical protein
MTSRGRPKMSDQEKQVARERRELARTATDAIVTNAIAVDRGGFRAGDDREARYGPAMMAIPEKWQRFVLALVQTGCTAGEAARVAGYTGSADVLKATGWRVRHDPRVTAAYFEEVAQLMSDHAVLAVGVLREVAENPTIDPKARIKAASELLSRSGFSAITEHRIVTDKRDVQRDPRVVAAQIVAAGRALGLNLDPTQLLGPPAEVVDAEFEELSRSPERFPGQSPEEAPPVRTGREGIEDLL